MQIYYLFLSANNLIIRNILNFTNYFYYITNYISSLHFLIERMNDIIHHIYFR